MNISPNAGETVPISFCKRQLFIMSYAPAVRIKELIINY